MDADPTLLELDAALAAYHFVAPPGRDDLVILSASSRLAKRIVFHLTGLGRLVPAGGGPDAADLALLREAPSDWVIERFDRLVIASGDGIFAELSHRVREAGREVWVASWARPLSRRLAVEATEVRLLDSAYGAAA